MDSKAQFLITCRFPGWSYVKDANHETGLNLDKTEHRGNGKDDYPPFGVRYLVTIPYDVLTKGTEPKEEMLEEDWAKLRTVEQNASQYAIEKIEKMTGDTFDGEILFVEQFNVVTL